MSEERELLKISELARRAGVGRGTIQHYLREGLLPRPVKTHRNMAYYDASYVERINTIKEMQTRRYLPLSVIRKLLATGDSNGAAAQSLVEAHEAALEALTAATQGASLGADAAAKAFGLSRRVLGELRRLGLAAPRREGTSEVYGGADLDVLAAVANLGRAGFRESAGFKISDLLIYRDALEAMLHHEIQTFVRATAGHARAARARDLARAGIHAATGLVVALRRKLLVDALSGSDSKLASEPARGERRSPGRARRQSA